MKNIFLHHRYKPQSKLWKQFRKPSAASRLWRNNSTCKLQSQMTFRLCTLFLKLGSHYNNRGIALITVILIVSILVAVAIELNRSTRAAIYDAANLSDGIKLTYIAKSGFYGAEALLSNSNNDCVTLRDNWANTETLSAQSPTLFTDGYFIVIVEDEAGKIPLNQLVKPDGSYNTDIYDILMRLLHEPEFGLDEITIKTIVDSIKDWIDADNTVTDYGAETAYYASLNPPYEAKNAPLDCIEELLMVKGITKDIFYGTDKKPALAQYVTTDSEGKININTAPKMVLRALALSDAISAELADKMDAYRRADGNDLSSPQWYQKVPGMAGVAIKVGLSTKSNYFKIISVGKMKNMQQTLSGIVKKAGQQSVQIIKWRQD